MDLFITISFLILGMVTVSALTFAGMIKLALYLGKREAKKGN